MCGFVGFISANGDAPDKESAVLDSIACAEHRGPDESGSWSNADVAFGFNRLSIIDVEKSHQPLVWGPSGDPERYTLIFNGEIYNYLELRREIRELVAENFAEHGFTEASAGPGGDLFRTEGDGEAIVAGFHVYGDGIVDRLRGMFAFLIWDNRTRTLTGARDHFGIKPLYYTELADGIAFASEAKSLHVFSGKHDVDTVALQNYLVLQYVPEPATMARAIRKIESGTSFTVEPGGKIRAERYFRPTFTSVPVSGEAAEQALADRIGESLRDSVAKHMRSDVTVGSFLSGGIDSTAIAALAKEHNPNLLTFTTGFDREGYSEIDVAAESAAAIGVEHIVRNVTADDFRNTVPLVLWYLDDPVADPALVPLYFVANEASKHVKVVLSGEGADELFGGYNIYREPMSLERLTNLPRGLRKGLGAVSKALPQGFRGKDLLRRSAIDLEERYYGNARIFRENQLPGLLRTYDSRRSFRDVTDPVYELSEGWDPTSRMQHVDLFTWLRGDILVKADKMTMANSLELRVPFMDKEVFEVARSIPLSQKVTATQTKVALRRAMRDIVPAHVLERRKLGFPVPIRLFLKDELFDWAKDIMENSATERFLDPKAAVQLLLDHRDGKADYSRQIWTVLVFQLWHEIFVTGNWRVNVPKAEPLSAKLD